MIDDFCKRLVARHPAGVGLWLLSVLDPAEAAAAQPPAAQGGQWTLLDRELSSDPLHADSVILLPQAGALPELPLLHIEFQTRPDAAIAERMLEYWIRLHRRFRRPIRQVVIHLKPTTSPLAWIEELAIGHTRHRFISLRLWEQDPAPLLVDPPLLPLAVLTRLPDGPAEQVLSQVRQRLQAIADPDQRRSITSGCQLLAGLIFPQDVIQRLLAMSILEDSSVYQYIVRKGLAEGRELGLELGRQQEAVTLLLRLLERRCAPLEASQRDTIAALPLERLEELGLALLDFQGAADLAAWLG
ncbi:MAG: Rpn family recombination-promoting nuclease/putative transposase [Cyanobacteriota bacterium]